MSAPSCLMCGCAWEPRHWGGICECGRCPQYQPDPSAAVVAALDRLTTAVYYLAAEHRAARLGVGMNDALDQVLRSRKNLGVVVAYEAKQATP